MSIEGMMNLYKHVDAIERKPFQIWQRHSVMVEENFN